MPDTIVLRRARLAEAVEIATLVGAFVGQGGLLPRSEASIRETISDWVVTRDADGILACGSLLFYTPVLAEVRSLAVAPRAQGLGLGSSVVRALISQAEASGVTTLFALTRAVPFFERLGFRISERARFPAKIWRDCTLCPFLENCNETAVALELPAGPA